MRICSFLPSATEIVYSLGLEESLVGRSHECDFPSSVARKPAVVRPLIEVKGKSPAEVDRAVGEAMREHGTLYVADEALLRGLRPDLVLTQDLCRVCAPSGEDLNSVVRRLPHKPRVISLNPRSVRGILDSILEVGSALKCEGRAREVVSRLEARLEAVRSRVGRAARTPKVFLLEWVEPPFASGHWCPEMVRLAGGREVLGREGRESRRVTWEEVANATPEILIVSPCGYHLDRVLPQAKGLPAGLYGQVFAVDADSYFARPGPRIVDGVELLAHLLHPDLFPWFGRSDAFVRV
ncbi:MAG TPA: cobalamin-binding protein [Planctomycetota bacterium]|nr:cobalamin-binding protein [Planctomycetota bacterium]